MAKSKEDWAKARKDAYTKSLAALIEKGISLAGIKELQRNEGKHAYTKIVERRKGQKTRFTIGSGHLLDGSPAARAAFRKAWGSPEGRGGIKWDDKLKQLMNGEEGKETIPEDVIQALFLADTHRKVDGAIKLFTKNGKSMLAPLPQDMRDHIFSGHFRGEFKEDHNFVKAIKSGDVEKAAYWYRKGPAIGKTYRLVGGGSIKAPDGIREDLGRAYLSSQGHRFYISKGKLATNTTGVWNRMARAQSSMDKEVLRRVEQGGTIPAAKAAASQRAADKVRVGDKRKSWAESDENRAIEKSMRELKAKTPKPEETLKSKETPKKKWWEQPVALGEPVASLGPILNGERLAFAIASTNSTQYPAEIDKTDPDTVHSDTELPGGGAFNA